MKMGPIGPIGWVTIAGMVIGAVVASCALFSLAGWAIAQTNELERLNWEGYLCPAVAFLLAGLNTSLLSLMLWTLDRHQPPP